MTIKNVEQEPKGEGNIFSTMMNALVLIMVVTVVVIPLLKKLKEMLKNKTHDVGNSSFSSQTNKNTSSPVQGFFNSQMSNENLGQLSSLSGNQSNNTSNGANQQSIQRSQNITQWNDRNEKFKSILEQEDNPITTIEDYNSQVRKFIGQKISFNVKLLFQELKNKNLEADCITFDYLMQIVLDSKNIEGAIDLFSIFQNTFSKLETLTPNIISQFLRAIQYGLNNQITSEQGILMVDQLNSIVEKYKLKLNEGSIIAKIDIALRANKLDQAMSILGDLEKDENWREKEDIQKKKCELYFQILKNLKGVQFSDNDDAVVKKLCQMIEYLNEKKEDENIFPDESMVNSLIDLCFQCNQAKLALDVYGYFDKFNISPSGVTYCILIKGYGQLKQYNYAMTIYQQMKTNKISLNEVTLGCLIDTCVKCNYLQRAEEILKEEKEIKPNTIIYTTLLKGYTKQENMKKALEIFEIMKSDKDLEPNIVSYNSLMECAVQCRDKEQMKKIFTEIMEQKDESKRADLITFSTYIKGLFKQGDIEEALVIFENLRKQEQYKLDEIFYNSILDGLFKARSYEKTQLLYQKMREDNIRPSNVTYSILIKLNSAQERIDEALRILQEMKTMNVKPGLIVYTCIIQACIKHKRIRELLPLYEDMKRNNVKGDSVFYNTLVSGLMFNNCLNDALKMTIDTLERRIILNQEVYQNLLSKVVSKKKIIENQNANQGGEIEEVNEVRSRTYSGSTRFTSNFSNASNAETELTLQEIEKYLQRILLLLKKYYIEIDMDLYKDVVNQVFVNNNDDEKKEYLSYLNQKQTGNMSRQNWGSRTLIPGPGTNYKPSNNSGTNYATLSNKYKSQSFQQRKRAGDSANQSSINIGEQYGGNNNYQNSGYSSSKNSQYRSNGGWNNGNSSSSFSQTNINISGTNNNNNEFYNRSNANSISSNKSGSSTNIAPKRFINKPQVGGGTTINDLKNQLEQNQVSFEETKKNEKTNGRFRAQCSILSNNSEKDEIQDQLLLEKNLEDFEKDSDNSFDSKGSKGEGKNTTNYTKQLKKSNYSKSKSVSKHYNNS